MAHISLLVQLEKKSDIFLAAHKLVEEYPQSHVSWFAVGAYYFSAKKFDQSRKYLRKCLSIKKNFMEGLILLGLSFSEQEEFDQAISTYRTASRLFPK